MRSLQNKPTTDHEFKIQQEDICFKFLHEYFESSSQAENDTKKSKDGQPFK